MKNRARLAVAAAASLLGVALIACSSGTSSGDLLTPQQQAQVTSTSGMQISATISAVTLGDECATAAGGGFAPTPAGDCAPAPAPSGGASSKEAPGGCGSRSYCQQSNVQIAFNASAGTSAAHVEIVSVKLFDGATGKLVDTLTASKPQAWNGNGYATWDQTIKPASDTKASYDLTAPAWSTLDASGSTKSSYSTEYKLQIDLRIDGVEVIIESTAQHREPQVAT